MGDVQSLRAHPAHAAVLLNRTNRADATRTGPDADAREALTEQEEYERCTQFLKDSSPTAAQTLG